MESLPVEIQSNPNTYLKDPLSSELGKRILTGSINLLDELGFESFTFKKLGKEIGSTEASIYRYFESKHKLLLYLTAWYWSWLEYQLVFGLANIDSPKDRFKKAISILTEEIKEDKSVSHIDEVKLFWIVINEAPKAYLTKAVDQNNSEGLFLGFKNLVNRVSKIILEIRPDYPYPHMLVSTIIEGGHNQRYFAEHLPRLTDFTKGSDSITTFYTELAFSAIKLDI